MQNAGKRSQQGGFAESWNAFEEDVAAREEANEHAVDDFLLADDDLADFLAYTVELRGRKLKSCLWLHLDILSH